MTVGIVQELAYIKLTVATREAFPHTLPAVNQSEKELTPVACCSFLTLMRSAIMCHQAADSRPQTVAACSGLSRP